MKKALENLLPFLSSPRDKTSVNCTQRHLLARDIADSLFEFFPQLKEKKISRLEIVLEGADSPVRIRTEELEADETVALHHYMIAHHGLIEGSASWLHELRKNFPQLDTLHLCSLTLTVLPGDCLRISLETEICEIQDGRLTFPHVYELIETQPRKLKVHYD